MDLLSQINRWEVLSAEVEVGWRRALTAMVTVWPEEGPRLHGVGRPPEGRDERVQRYGRGTTVGHWPKRNAGGIAINAVLSAPVTVQQRGKWGFGGVSAFILCPMAFNQGPSSVQRDKRGQGPGDDGA